MLYLGFQRLGSLKNGSKEILFNWWHGLVFLTVKKCNKSIQRKKKSTADPAGGDILGKLFF